MGLLSVSGSSVDEFWSNWLLNKSQINEKNKVDIPSIVPSMKARRMDRFSLMALTASTLALQHSDLDVKLIQTGTIFSTIYGSLSSNEKFAREILTVGPDLASPLTFANTVANSCVGYTALNLKLQGVSTMLMGSNSIGYAADLLQKKQAEAVLAGGIEELNEHVIQSYTKMGYVDQNEYEHHACRPLDCQRQGIAIREGAAVLVLEREEVARKRGARMLAEVVGYGGAFSKVSPERAVMEPIQSRPFVYSMLNALDEAHLRSEEIDAIHMAASGSRFGDLAEAQAIHEVFGERARRIPVTTVKGFVGETFGASLALGVLGAVLSMSHQVLPPSVGCELSDPEMDLSVVTSPLEGSFQHMMINGYDIGGNIHSLIIRSIN
jgi:3-oxoacyl-[acyl-carrier-protein] synthase II